METHDEFALTSHPQSYIISRSGTGRDCVEAWSVARLPFEPKAWLKNLRADLRDAVKALTCAPDQVLHATYLSTVNEPCDAENILLYNVGSGPFSGSAQRGVRFERVFSDPPRPPWSLGDQPLHYQRYEPAASRDGFRHWERGRKLVRWAAVKCVGLQSSTKPESVWYQMKCGTIKVMNEAVQEPATFGLSVAIGVPPELRGRTFNVAGLIKPVFDGIISSFHVHDGAALKEVSDRLAPKLGVESRDVAHQLVACARATVLGMRRLVRPFGESGVQWNPADDRCVAGELQLRTNETGDSSWELSGELFELASSEASPRAG